MICNFPSCIKGWLDVQDITNDDIQNEDINTSVWKPQFCILMENDSKLYIFENEPSLEEFPIPDHIDQIRLDIELNSNQMPDSCSCIDDFSTISSKNHDSEKYNSNSSLSHLNNNISSKQYMKSGIFRNGSRFFRRAKSNIKLNSSLPSSGKEGTFENSLPTKSVSNLKRSLSLSRLNRKKSEEKSESKSPRSILKTNQLITQSTGDLTIDISSVCMARHNLQKDSIIADVHPSLVGERSHCFSVTSLAVDINSDSGYNSNLKGLLMTKRIFAGKSLLEKQCWMRRLQQTLRPNFENENRLNNFLKITIFESKYLSTQRRYFCEVSVDKVLLAKTTSKMANSEGCVFWAEDIVLNNLPHFKTLNINLYKEPDPIKHTKKKKRKNNTQCIGGVMFTITNLNSKNEIQSWFNIKSLDILPDLNTNPIQLRVKLHYQALKVLKCESYDKLAQIAIKNYLDLILFLEKNLPVKLREEVASCLVNIHETNGTIVEFLTNLISQEVNDLDNSSMTLRANTIVTKIIESHMKLVGSQYLHNMLHSFIRDVMFKNVTIEVDSSRMDFGNQNQDIVILDNQHRLIEYLKHIWYKIYDSKDHEFPKQLKLVFTCWRKILESSSKKIDEKEKKMLHCDVIVSGCIFLRLLCPAILSPHLFGLVSHFSEKPSVQRTLTLIAKSLQSLANFSEFGDKEHFMIFLNQCFEEEIPRMREFLRHISSIHGEENIAELQDSVKKEIVFYGSTIDLSVELARLHSCLSSDSMKDNLNKPPKFQNVLKLPDIIREINQQLQSCYPHSTSFFSHKKPQISSSNDQRRSSLGPLVNSKIQELGRSEKDSSPPRLGSPICHSKSVVDPVSEYGVHSTDVWQMRSDINCNNPPKLSKIPVVTPVVYSTKQQYTISPIPKNQMNFTSFHRGHYNTREIEENQISELSHKKNFDQKHMSMNSNIHNNQSKSAFSKSIQPQNKRIPTSYYTPFQKNPVVKSYDVCHYSKVNDIVKFDSTKRKLKPEPSGSDLVIQNELDEFYCGNPLYDYVDSSVKSIYNPERQSQNTIDRYFNVRSAYLNLLDQQQKQNNLDSSKDQIIKNLQDLYQEMESMNLDVQNEQMKDLKQLNQIINLNKSGDTINQKMYSSLITNSHIDSSSIQKELSNLGMTEALDEVINTITIDGAGLEEAQFNLRRQHLKKERSAVKVQSMPASNRPRQQLASRPHTTNNNVATSLDTVPIDFTEPSSPVIISSQSSTPVKSQSSSNCSSLTPWLI